MDAIASSVAPKGAAGERFYNHTPTILQDVNDSRGFYREEDNRFQVTLLALWQNPLNRPRWVDENRVGWPRSQRGRGIPAACKRRRRASRQVPLSTCFLHLLSPAPHCGHIAICPRGDWSGVVATEISRNACVRMGRVGRGDEKPRISRIAKLSNPESVKSVVLKNRRNSRCASTVSAILCSGSYAVIPGTFVPYAVAPGTFVPVSDPSEILSL